MIISQSKKVLILVVVFIVLGATALLFTENRVKTVKQPSLSADELVADNSDYIRTIEPWLSSVLADNSAANISSIREKFLNLRSADSSVGEAHLHLFLGFDAWQKFLDSRDDDFKNKALVNFSAAAKIFPDLESYIEKIQAILQNA